MSNRLQNKICVVVGAGQQAGATIGNGRATSIRFAQEGARLVLVDRDPTALDQTVTDVRAAGAECIEILVDITADEAPGSIVDAATAAFGRLDVLHNNVGIGGMGCEQRGIASRPKAGGDRGQELTARPRVRNGALTWCRYWRISR